MLIALFNIISIYDSNTKNSVHNSITNKIITFIEEHFDIVKYLITFAQTTLFLDEVGSGAALGYEGPDVYNYFISKIITSGKLKYQNTSEWIWAHSDMKIPSKNAMDYVYKKSIINKKTGIKQFGLYK
jgi:hypothetical protein